MDDWCPENDGAYQAEMAAKHRDSLEEQNHRLRASLDSMTAERDGAKADADNWFQRCVDAEAERDAALEDNASVRAKALEDAARVADGYHAAALEWAKKVRGLERHIDQTDSSRIAAAIRAMKESNQRG